jgi:tRNA-specific 2-thiouridylase
VPETTRRDEKAVNDWKNVPVRVLVAMSGGVDSSVAAAILRDQGHEVVGATLKLWGGASDSGCCSVADVEDARSVAHRLGVDHHLFNFADEFERSVVAPYALAHASGYTPNPCVECNRHIKFGRLLSRAVRLGFDAVATGHHARVTPVADGARHRLLRGLDADKDQSYVLSMLSESQLARLLLPIGELTKTEVRATARALGLRTAAKPDSQDVCFIQSRTDPAARASFLAQRIELHRGAVVDVRTGDEVGELEAVELVTVGQRRGLGSSGSGTDTGTGETGRAARRYVVAVDTACARVLVGGEDDLLTEVVTLGDRCWTHEPLAVGADVLIQCSAHGAPRAAVITEDGVRTAVPARRVAPGQTVALYDGDEVVGSGVAA